MMTAKTELSRLKRTIDRELERILSQDDSLLFEAMRYTVLSGGKRFRPLLVLSSGECFNVEQKHLLPFACAIELIHNYSLIHDDLPAMDNDDFRRGKPSSHKAFGEDIALLTGDSLLTLAFEVIAEAPFPPQLASRKELATREISRYSGAKGMIEGQFLDITFSPEKVTEEGLHELMFKKTGGLIVASVKVGAILGGASVSQVEAVSEYGNNVGLAFQIRDDILDAGQKERKDLPPRPNYVWMYGIEEASDRMRGCVQEALGALDAAALESDKLRELALVLLNPGRDG